MNYFWSTTGNDSNPGTQDAPKRNMLSVLPLLRAGDTGLARGGVYAEWSNNQVPGGVSWSAPVTVKAYPGEPVTLQPPSGADRCFTFLGAGIQYIVIDGFVLDAVNALYDVVKVTLDDATGIAAHHIRVQNSELKNARNNGVLVGGDLVGGNEFLNLDIHSCARFDFNPYGHGVYFAGSNNLLEACRVHDQASNVNGFQVQVYHYGSNTDCNGNIVRRCALYGNSGRAGLVLSSGNGNIGDDNLIYASDAGIVLFNSDGQQAINNTIYGCVNRSIEIKDVCATSLARNNICFGNGQNAVLNSGPNNTVDHNLDDGRDPLFVNPSGADFSLRAGSPAIGAGQNCTPVDYYGNARTYCDLGAIAYQSAPQPTPDPVPIPPPPTPTPLPPPPTPLPVTPVFIKTVMDGSGRTWGLTATGDVYTNGVKMTTGATNIASVNGIAYVLASDSNWYWYSFSDFAWYTVGPVLPSPFHPGRGKKSRR